jgi:hypothetical protein
MEMNQQLKGFDLILLDEKKKKRRIRFEVKSLNSNLKGEKLNLIILDGTGRTSNP